MEQTYSTHMCNEVVWSLCKGWNVVCGGTMGSLVEHHLSRCRRNGWGLFPWRWHKRQSTQGWGGCRDWAQRSRVCHEGAAVTGLQSKGLCSVEPALMTRAAGVHSVGVVTSVGRLNPFLPLPQPQPLFTLLCAHCVSLVIICSLSFSLAADVFIHSIDC